MESDYLQAAAFLGTADCRCFMTNGIDQHIACVILMSFLGKMLHYIGCRVHGSMSSIIWLTHPLRLCQSLSFLYRSALKLIFPLAGSKSVHQHHIFRQVHEHCSTACFLCQRTILPYNSTWPRRVPSQPLSNTGSRGMNPLGSFCQGYSPGGGDSCMTMPSGC